MNDLRIRCASRFDGDAIVDTPCLLTVRAGRIATITADDSGDTDREVAFAMPGLVEAHAHLFLDGDERNAGRRAAYLDGPTDAFATMAQDNLGRLLAAGITLVRDAGDRHGVNLGAKAWARTRRQAGEACPQVRACGPAIRKRGRYGGFMAVDVRDAAEATRAVERLPADVDDCKILATGVIDFTSGTVKGAPQFHTDELEALVAAAARRGLPTFAHCSGREGLARAIAAGVGSIEHGFFMDEDLLAQMADSGIAWVGTWSPVSFMRDQPTVAGLDAAAVDGLKRILDQHLAMTARAHDLGVTLVAGSDAGSWGVPFGSGLHGELAFLAAAGLPLTAVLRAATRAPRRCWGLPGGSLAAGQPADLALYDRHPRDGLHHLRRPVAVLVEGLLRPLGEPEPCLMP